jgi:hypothetical protein
MHAYHLQSVSSLRTKGTSSFVAISYLQPLNPTVGQGPWPLVLACLGTLEACTPYRTPDLSKGVGLLLPHPSYTHL